MITTSLGLQIIIFATLHSHANHFFFTFSLFSSNESEIFFHFFFCSIKEKMVVEKFFLDSPIFELKGFLNATLLLAIFFFECLNKVREIENEIVFVSYSVGPLGKVKKVIIMRTN